MPLSLHSDRYTEPPAASRAIREELWRELVDYAASLPPCPLPHVEPVPSAAELRRALGFPPPLLPSTAPVGLRPFAVDGRARYFRCFSRLLPSLRAYGLLVIPHVHTPCPLLIVHHGGNGFPELPLFEHGNYHDLCDGALAAGYALFLPHYLFQPYFDRDEGTPIPKHVREEVDGTLRAAGTTLLAVELARQNVLLNHILTHPSINPARVAAAGLSYGGFFALYSAALDSRIGAVIASCAFRARSVQDPAKPSARIMLATSLELAALVAPRPLHIQAGLCDNIYSIENVRDAIPAAWQIYRDAGASAALNYVEFPGTHEFHGPAAWPFLASIWPA